MLRRTAEITALVSLLGACALVACGGIVVVDEVSGTGGAGGASVTGPGTTGPSTATASTGPTTTTVSSGTGPPPCTSCSEFIQGEGDYPDCPGSEQLYYELLECWCFDACELECEDACQGFGDGTPECFECVSQSINGACQGPANACFQDF